MKKQKNVTNDFAGMIEAFECDFMLARDRKKDLCTLQEKIDAEDERMMRDIELLGLLSYGLRNGNLKIVIEEEEP